MKNPDPLRAAAICAETTVKAIDRLMAAEVALDNISDLIRGHDPDDWAMSQIQEQLDEYNKTRAS